VSEKRFHMKLVISRADFTADLCSCKAKKPGPEHAEGVTVYVL